jgi:mevalonate kinase
MKDLYQSRLNAFLKIKEIAKHSISIEEFNKLAKDNKIPHSTSYLKVYQEVGILIIKENRVFIKDLSLELLTKAYKLKQNKPFAELNKKIQEAKKFLEANDYVVIKKTSNNQILVCTKIY